MPYVPPHLRAGSQSGATRDASASRPPPGSRYPGTHPGRGYSQGGPRGRGPNHPQIMNLGIRKATWVEQRILLDDNDGSGGDMSGQGRDSYVFVEYAGTSYPHLRDQRLYVVTPASEAGAIWAQDKESQSPNLQAVEVESMDKTSASPEEAVERGPPSEAVEGNNLFENIRDPVAKGLTHVHLALSSAAASSLRRTTFEKAKLAVRFGRCIFTKGYRSSSGAEMEVQPPFVRSQFETQANRRGRPLTVDICRHFETSLEEEKFERMTDLALNSATHRIRNAKFYIRIQDTEHSDLVYRLVCVAVGTSLRLVKVSDQEMRHAVVDVVRPHKDLDFRIILTTQTYYTSLPNETIQAFESIISAATVDANELGGVHLPLDNDAAASGRRFVVKSVRHSETMRVHSDGLSWRFRKVSGREVSMGGRLTNEVEFVPEEWRTQLKTVPSLRFDARGLLTEVRNEAPDWSPELLLDSLPNVLNWMEIKHELP